MNFKDDIFMLCCASSTIIQYHDVIYRLECSGTRTSLQYLLLLLLRSFFMNFVLRVRCFMYIAHYTVLSLPS